MESVAELTRIASEAQEKLAEIKYAEFRKSNGPKVGKTYTYRNSYSCPKMPTDYWTMYVKVTRMDETGILYATQFQTDQYGNIDIKFDQCIHHAQYYTPCPKAMFNKAWRALLKRLNGIHQ